MKTVCLQVGHWGIESITQEGLRSWRDASVLKSSTGASGERVYHWEEVMPLLRDKLIGAGVQVYIAGATYDKEIYSRDYDLWISVHYDGGGTGERCMASAPNRNTKPAYLNQTAQTEAERFVSIWKDMYPGIVGVPYKEEFVTNKMTDYYAFDYVSYNTPAVILEHFNHQSVRGTQLKQSPEAIADADFKAIVKFFGIPEKPTVQKDTYTIVYKNQVLQEYEFNPSDKIADLSTKLEITSKEKADLVSEKASLAADLEDARAIESEFRRELSEARTERDDAKSTLATAESKLKIADTEILTYKSRIKLFESEKPILAYTSGELFSAWIKKILNRG